MDLSVCVLSVWVVVSGGSGLKPLVVMIHDGHHVAKGGVMFNCFIKKLVTSSCLIFIFLLMGDTYAWQEVNPDNIENNQYFHVTRSDYRIFSI